mgnify:CR=1 FL=1
MTTTNPTDLKHLESSYTMPPTTVSGLCTKEIDDPGSCAPNFSNKLRREDAQFFQGNKIEAHDKQHCSDQQLLHCIDANFEVIPEAFHSRRFDRTHSKSIHWLRSDNGDELGRFSDQRKPLHPLNAIHYFKEFCEKSQKQINLDVLGFEPGTKKLYFASKITNRNADLIHVGDKTDHWMIFTIDYMQPKAMKTFVWHNELVCTNGMTKMVQDDAHYLTHRKVRNFDDIFPYLDNALRECDDYEDLKDQLIDKKIDPITAKNVIKTFFLPKKTEEEDKKRSLNISRLERIYEHDLIGGHLDTRQGNAFRLQQAFTQWTSHHRKAKNEDYRFSQKLGGDLARLDNRATQLIREAVGV